MARWVVFGLLVGLGSATAHAAAVGDKSEAPEGDKEEVERPSVKPLGIFVVNAGYNSKTLIPGSYAYYALFPQGARSQFYVSVAQSVLGLKLSDIRLKSIEISGSLALSLRSPQPLLTANVLAPLFYDVHIEAKKGAWQLLVGWYPDLVLTVLPDTLNIFPASYLPGSLGFARPQLRVRLRQSLGRLLAVRAALSANTPIQTFDLAGELIGRQAGLPDGQGRLVLDVGDTAKEGAFSVELSAAGHFGRRRLGTLAGDIVTTVDTWSLGGDARVRFGPGPTLKARWWRGAVLGDYAAGAFQTASPSRQKGIHATGWFVSARQPLGERFRVAAGFGRDNPKNSDVDPGERTLNEAAFANLTWDITRIVGVGLELARWRTAYRGLGTTALWRADLVFFITFGE